MLNKFWSSKIKYNWVFGLLFIFILGIPRFIIVLKSYVTGNSYFLPLVFITMWFLPFVFLSKEGRKYIGFKRVSNKMWLVYALFIGIGICFIIYLTGVLLYGDSIKNWFVYLSKSGIGASNMDSSQRLIYFLIAASISILFSPLGEELFFRGLIHGSFQVDVGDQKASYIDSLAFALTHIAHFGIVFNNGKWEFLFIPSILWVFFMFITSRLFFICKKKSGSILGAIICHAAFNFSMMYFIFYHIIE